MAQFDRVVETAAAGLYEDERLRSNLTDDEAKVVLDWAVQRIAARANAAKDEAGAKKLAQEELARVRGVVTALNGLAKKSGPLRLAEAVAAIEPLLQGNKPFGRDQVLAAAISLVDGIWQTRVERGAAKS